MVNDFGRKNLYRNNGDGTFTDVAAEAGVEDIGAGMSVCWFDYDNDGRKTCMSPTCGRPPASGSHAGWHFKTAAPAANACVLPQARHGQFAVPERRQRAFQDSTAVARAGMGRWSWSSDAWDFDHDGFPDLYIANGMISGPVREDLNSFFWRQVVAKSPADPQSVARIRAGLERDQRVDPRRLHMERV